MKWIAPSEKDTAAATLEKRLWDAADQFRANSGLKAQEYSGPILGLIFLLFAEVRFTAQHAKLQLPSPSGRGDGGEGAPRVSRRGSRVEEPAAYHADNILYLPAEARFDYLLHLPEAADIGAKVNAAMREIEKHNPQLAGVLPKTYNLFTSTLLKELLKKVSEIPATADYDAFGRIYEYFLGEFARTEGQKGGEFYTPSPIVRLLTEIIEPYHGRILDPACGSGGMFVSSARFVAEHKASPPSPQPSPKGRGSNVHPSTFGRRDGDEGLAAQYSGDPSRELAICGVEKTDETGRLCRLNLAVHGLEGDIRHGGNVNSYYDDPFDACRPEPSPQPSPKGRGSTPPSTSGTSVPLVGRRAGDEGHESERHGRFDFVLANPPFNVNAVDKERLKDSVGAGRRFPFGLPRTDNANYLWIQLFYSALNATGRAGFVMANSASDARSSEQELRQQLIAARGVDVMVAVGPNMFYTVTLPCTLWFLDKAKQALPPSPQPSPNGRGSTPPSTSGTSVPLVGRRAGDEGEQRGARYSDTVLFIDARHIYRQIDRAHRDWTPAQIGFIANLVRLYRGEEPDYTLGGTEAKAKLTELFSPRPPGEGPGVRAPVKPTPNAASKYKDLPAEHLSFARQLRQQQPDAENLMWGLLRDRRLGGFKFRRQHPLPPYVLDFYCHELKFCVELDGGQHAERTGHDAKRDSELQNQGIRTLRFWNNQVLAETESVLMALWEALHEAPSPPTPLPVGEGLYYRDVPGLCRAATLQEIEAQGWSLNPGRYVGVAPGEAVSDEDFKEQLETLNEELETLNAQARELEATIAQNVTEILES